MLSTTAAEGTKGMTCGECGRRIQPIPITAPVYQTAFGPVCAGCWNPTMALWEQRAKMMDRALDAVLKQREAAMTCKHCGVQMLNASPDGSLEYYTHPGGPCASQSVLLGDVTLTREEVLALKRVAQAQLEIETKRGRNG